MQAYGKHKTGSSKIHPHNECSICSSSKFSKSNARREGQNEIVNQLKEVQMIPWLVVLKQKGGGCDHTIGCGIMTIIVTAKTREEAIKEIKSMITGDHEEYRFTGDHELRSVILAENITHLPIKDWYREAAEAEEVKKQEKQKREELNELNRLRNKYPND